MHASATVTQSQLPELLLEVATVRPVFIHGQPGIGKSSLVEQFADSVGLPCVTLLGTQLAPEDLMGVPQIIGTGPDARSQFCPPLTIARPDPYVLFLDELNSASSEVQKSFYSLILDKRIGTYELPEGSVVIAAGNRAQDNAITRPMSSALVNRMVHVHLEVEARDWLRWAEASGVHPSVLAYVRARPDHLSVAAPKTQEPFSTPRSWHMLSDLLTASPSASPELLKAYAHGCLSAPHATQFLGHLALERDQYDLDRILKGELSWPADPSRRDTLYFLAHSLRARLAKELPAQKSDLSPTSQALAHRAKALLASLAEISVEVTQTVVTGAGTSLDGTSSDLPQWFFVEVVRDLPRLASARS